MTWHGYLRCTSRSCPSQTSVARRRLNSVVPDDELQIEEVVTMYVTLDLFGHLICNFTAQGPQSIVITGFRAFSSDIGSL